VTLAVQPLPEGLVIEIADNGIGLPPDRARLFEPYVTTREKGTGLGLPIVKKIIEEHGGTLELVDAEEFSEGAHRGAMARITLPRLRRPTPGRVEDDRYSGGGRRTGYPRTDLRYP
jgi:two-component system nitrogen regulation sensor histidine kinase NtrY